MKSINYTILYNNGNKIKSVATLKREIYLLLLLQVYTTER